MDVRKIELSSVNRIHLALGRDKWRTLVNTNVAFTPAEGK